MIVIYIRLMLEAIENDCVIDYEGTFDNYTEELALRLGVSEEQIKMTLAYFVKCGVIQVDSDGNTHYPQAKALLGQETNWNRYKKKQKLENFQPHSNYIPTEKEIEKEIEKDIKLEKDINIDIKSEVDKKQTAADKKSDFNIFEYYQSRIGVLDGYQSQKLNDYIHIDNLTPELVKRAIDRAADNSKRNFGYVNSILKNWSQNGIKTIVQQDEEQRNFDVKKAQRSYFNQQPAKSNVPDWVEADFKHEATAEEQAKLDELKKSLMED